MMKLLDEDGYPTEEALKYIETFNYESNYFDLMKFVKSIWYLASWGWTESETYTDDFNRQTKDYKISTAGWSGNEDIIRALVNNKMFWSFCWVSSRRGGHYEFTVREEESKNDYT